MRGGFLPAWRKVFDPSHKLHPHSTGEPACRGFAWLDMCSMARVKPDGTLDRGQLHGSVRTFAKRWNWSRSKTARVLQEWAKSEQIEIAPTVNKKRDGTRDGCRQKSGQLPSVITICNYDTYNFQPNGDGTVNAEMWDGTRTKDGTRSKSNKGKETNMTDFEAEFDKLCNAWKGRPNNPRKPALDKYCKLRRSGVTEKELQDAVRRYYRYCKAKGQLGTDTMLQTQTFFGPNERWKDDFGESSRKQNEPPLLNE